MERPLAAEGRAQAVLITADEPSAITQYAAEEFQQHVHQATGVLLPIAPESNAPDAATRIFIGPTREAAQRGVKPSTLQAGAFMLRTAGPDLFVLGEEEPGADPRHKDSEARGTLFGVYELLDRFVGVRWLWPGPLGTYVPRRETLAISGDLDEVIEPAFQFRRFRTGHISRALTTDDPEVERQGMTRPTLEAYNQDLNTYLARHRIGDKKPKPPVGHYFCGWWEQYGEEHPEWFMMRPDGGRGPATPEAAQVEDEAAESELVRRQRAATKSHVAMCVSNPDLHRFIVDEVWDGGDYLRLGEVDRRIFCQCDNCRAWDGPQPENPPAFAAKLYQPQMVSDRYARFWLTIQEMAAKRNPNVTVTTFLYWNYMPAPLSGITLNKNIYGEFVPFGQPSIVYYPMADAAHEWNKQQWLGWEETGVTMAYRPNYLLGGYVMPHLSTWQVGDFFQFAAEHGMIGFDQDSLWAQWAVKGPMLYLHMRLAVDPKLPIAQIRQEYFEAFGPAAAAVERYFDYWENYSLTRPGSDMYWAPVDADVGFPPEVFPPAEALLDEALEAVKGNPLPEYEQRVKFLQAGLEHARLAAAFIATLDRRQDMTVNNGLFDGTNSPRLEGCVPVDDPKRLRAAKAAMHKLVEFRRAHEHMYIADLVNAANRESQRIRDIDKLFED